MFLNPFPELLSYSFFAPLFLRLCPAISLWSFGSWAIGKDKIAILSKYAKLGRINTVMPWKLAILSFLVGGALAIGAYTQIASLFAIALFLSFASVGVIPKGWASTLVIIAFTLILTGAGAPALDLPL
jgi:uncharacterized membrane protein YphA (DoxX/SURF4 family)